MTARFCVAGREKQNQPKLSLCSVSVSLVQLGWRRAPFLRRHCHEMDGRSAALPQRDAVLYGSGGRAEGEQLSRSRRGGSVRLLVCLPSSSPAGVCPGAPSPPRADGRELQPGRAHLPRRLPLCLWNERCAAAVSGRSGAARWISAIPEKSTFRAWGGIKTLR
ncbi:uncharacterized protein LOC116652771 [Coturnix japonica]|uniref:uncharacterized protein LOC116652771 n=1 Tax=Coturnix japonica TaxID=93934 RepID=UPI0013A5E397|nr:uncharacterized protein LOC116652771 [Coturnix japonica]